ncbi:MAG: carboxy-S-adenosyl-L-methionine synthase CmoA [Gammaproteobacteria bacterium]|nr:MAG: carboxy-S-adenosyl-L-methionine synthase CmoA [Gammaproteobacteria bacterium]
MTGKDTLFDTPQPDMQAFQFDERVASVFSDMINRSVPGYAMTLEMIGVITRAHAQPGSRLYDLGCSLGGSTLAMRRAAPEGCEIIAVDTSAPMLERCRINIDREPEGVPVTLLEQDIRHTTFENATLVTLNFTLQFIPEADRLPLLTRIADGMHEGGALVLSEKIHFDDPVTQAQLTELHHGFKRARGYSDLEIAQKRAALENVLIPETLETHLTRLRQAGFSHAACWFQCFNFISVLAVK